MVQSVMLAAAKCPSPFTNKRRLWKLYWHKRWWANRQTAGGNNGNSNRSKKRKTRD